MIYRKLRVVIVGTGRLAKVLAQAAALSTSPGRLTVYGRNTAARDEIIASAPAVAAGDEVSIAHADIVVLAVSAQAYKPVIQSLSPHLPAHAILVSVTNAVAVEEIGAWTANPVVKVIPTLAQTVRRGVIPVIAGPHANAVTVDMVMYWLRGFSQPIEIDDRDSRVASNIAGSAVAAVACIARAFVAANARRAHGLDRQALDALMAETLSAVGDLARAGISFDQAIETTATPGGVTEAALVPLGEAIDEICERMVAASFRKQSQLQMATARAKGDA